MRKLGLAGVLLAFLPLLAHRRPPVASSERPRSGHHAKGAVHVHTGRSHDGRESLRTVVRAAGRARLDFLVITDHNADAPRDWAGRHEGVLVITGQEKSTDGGHALVLGIPRLPFKLDGDASAVARDARDLGGFVVAAHPTSSHPESAWRGGLEGVAGLEVINFAEPEAWPRSTAARFAALFGYALDPRGSLLRSFRYDREALLLFDAGLRQRPLAALLGSDAHGGLGVGRWFLPAPSHARVFELASQHLLLERPLGSHPAHDTLAVLEALRQGRGWAALDGLADASGFAFEAESGGRRASMGEALAFDGRVTLRASAGAPPATTLVLLRDGREVARGPQIQASFTEPGVYRVEAYLDSRFVPGDVATPWILSNAISVFPEQLLRERAERASALPAEPVLAVAPAQLLDVFDGPALRPEWRVDAAAASANAGLEAGVLRFDFTLGPGPQTHASVCDWTERDLSGATGLAFRARASRLMRFDVQVRTLDLGPGGVRIWRRSVRASPEWQETALPWSALRTYDRRGGVPDLARVRGIYFHVDESNLDPGQGATLWIDDVRIVT